MKIYNVYQVVDEKNDFTYSLYGQYLSFIKAKKDIENNYTDICETCFNYVYLQEVIPGMAPDIENVYVFKFNGKGKYVLVDTWDECQYYSYINKRMEELYIKRKEK